MGCVNPGCVYLSTSTRTRNPATRAAIRKDAADGSPVLPGQWCPGGPRITPTAEALSFQSDSQAPSGCLVRVARWIGVARLDHNLDASVGGSPRGRSIVRYGSRLAVAHCLHT